MVSWLMLHLVLLPQASRNAESTASAADFLFFLPFAATSSNWASPSAATLAASLAEEARASLIIEAASSSALCRPEADVSAAFTRAFEMVSDALASALLRILSASLSVSLMVRSTSARPIVSPSVTRANVEQYITLTFSFLRLAGAFQRDSTKYRRLEGNAWIPSESVQRIGANSSATSRKAFRFTTGSTDSPPWDRFPSGAGW
uniref:Uncharacterized protein n=1 Tax=uncultured marine group II/III euryarchaeote AD1000_35_F01 TaxID=1457758 RepID=A0A075FQE1_9EURY|nr:hypothetical protein [uncultured marine group II/III euryarchaeote AD1000_35_F01]